MAKTFEYRVSSIRYDYGETFVSELPDIAQQLDALGADGWELVQVYVLPSRTEPNVVFQYFYFKREV